MAYYNFSTENEAQEVIDQINTEKGIPAGENVGTETYGHVYPHSGGYAIRKDKVTEQYCEEVELIEELETE